jgi:hypothetical protein
MARDLFGHNITEVSTHLLGDAVHADRLLRQNTFFGVFRHAMSELVVASWADELKFGRHLSSLGSLGASPSDLGALFARSLRSCGSCIAADRELQGFATWKLAHQVAAIDRCPEHGSPLDLECRPIGGTHERIWPLHLPGESQTSSMPPGALPPSEGYAAYLRLWQRVFTEELPWLKPSAWILSMQAAVSRLGGIDVATDAIKKDVLRAWGAPIADIAAALLLGRRDDPIREELLLRSRPKHLARRMLLHGSLDRLGLELHSSTEGDQRTLVLSGVDESRAPIRRSPSVDRLLEFAELSGLPLASINLPELNVGFPQVSRALGIHNWCFRRFLANVRTEVLQGLMDSLQFSSESWVGSEIARRRRLCETGTAQETLPTLA